MEDLAEAYLKPANAILQVLGSDATDGLSKANVGELQAKYGLNVLPEEDSAPWWRLVLEQFKDKLVLVLLASAAVSFALALVDGADDKLAFVDPLVILAILVLNACVGVWQEVSAEKAIAALSHYAPDECKVLRDGRLTVMRTEELVPGDVVHVATGDKVPADCRLLQVLGNAELRVDQAILTGESEPVSKQADVPAGLTRDSVMQDRSNMLYSGSSISSGRASAIVVQTGRQTAIGGIHHSITSQISEPTPLKEKLDAFGDMLARVIAVICVLVWVMNIPHFSDAGHGGWVKGAIYYLKIAVALAVAAIPEGLAAVITTCLALGTRKMAKNNAIVRTLPSVETLGSTSVICSDKTGTLTTNQMSVSLICMPSASGDVSEFHITGDSYSPEGYMRNKLGMRVENPLLNIPGLALFSQICSVCNNSSIDYDDASKTFYSVGEPTEAALKVLVEKLGFDNGARNRENLAKPAHERYNAVNAYIGSSHIKEATLEFSRDRKSMSVFNRVKGGKHVLFVKGAPESILDRCESMQSGHLRTPIDSTFRRNVLERVANYGSEGLRVIALAMTDKLPSLDMVRKARTPEEYAKIEQDLTFVGLACMRDPPRPNVAAAISKCKSAGIRVVVITGDNKQTAESVVRHIGLCGSDEDMQGLSYTGREFDALSKAEQRRVVERAIVYSRVEPGHKIQLVQLLQEAGHVVAMTGDGVNDAPALRKADIGIAMGSGTDVSKLAADMVLADDDFSTIEIAIEEGRGIFSNTQQFIRYLISSNIGEVVSIFLTAMLGMPEALMPVQLLWVNLVTDGLPATALSFNRPDASIMKRAPRPRNSPLVDGWLFFRYMVVGIYVGAATVFGYAWWFMYYSKGPHITFYQLSHFHECAPFTKGFALLFDCSMFSGEMAKHASTMSLSILVVIEMLNAMNALSHSESLVTLPVWHNMVLVGAIVLSMSLHLMILYIPSLQAIFNIVPLDAEEWLAVVLISIPVILIDELLKFAERSMDRVAALRASASIKTKVE